MVAPGRDPSNFTAHAVFGLNGPLRAFDGTNVAIGFLDYGFDVLHPTLRCARGRTRLLQLWDQNAGALHSAGTIDRWIDEADTANAPAEAYRVYDPHAHYFMDDEPDRSGAHGTLMASIAAGSRTGHFSGVAPAASLVGVQFAMLDHHWKEQDDAGTPTWTDWDPARNPFWQGWRDYDEAPQISSALSFLHDAAARAGCDGLVVNLSIGTNAGAHDGGSSVERAIRDLVEAGDRGRGPAVAVVAAAGNAAADCGHFQARLVPGASSSLAWHMADADRTQNKIEIWYEGDGELDVCLSHGSAETLVLGPIRPGRTHDLRAGGVRIGIADHTRHVRGPLSRVRVLLHPPYFPEGMIRSGGQEHRFEIALTARDGCGAISLHAWVERDDGDTEQSWLSPSTPTSTLTPIACAERVIAVGGYELDRDSRRVFARSSLGPRPWSRSGREAPTVVAPAVGLWGARSKTAGFARTTGTSAACALVSGLVARLYQRAAARGQRLSHDELVDVLRGLLTQGGRHSDSRQQDATQADPWPVFRREARR